MTIPSGIKKVIIPLGIMFLFGASWYGLYRPEFEKISKYRAAPLAARSLIEAAVRKLSQYNPPTPGERLEWSGLQKELEHRIPQGRQITELYAYISAQAESCGLKNLQRQELQKPEQTFEDGGVTRSGFEIQLNFDCDYASLVKFIEYLQKSERLVDLVSLQLTRKLPVIGVQLVIRSYYFPSSG